MSAITALSRAARQWPTQARQAIARIGAVPATIRLVATLAAMGSVAAAAPAIFTEVQPGVPVACGLGAIGVGLFPRTRWVTAFLVLAVGLWILDTVDETTSVSVLRAGLLAALVYLTHSAAALAAVLPYDCVVTFRVLRAWVGRLVTVVLAGVGIGMAGMVAVTLLPTARSIVGPIVGSAIAAGLAGLLAWHLRRK